MSVSKNREKFVRLADTRVNRALKDLKLIGNLSNRTNYIYTKDDIDKIFRALNVEIKATRARFDNALSKKDKIDFKLE